MKPRPTTVFSATIAVLAAMASTTFSPLESKRDDSRGSAECELARGLTLIEEWRYAPPETSDYDRLIGLPVWITRHPEAGVYVVDLLGRSLLHLSPGGDFVRRIGRQGEGPGEFQSPTMVRATERGFAVFDRLAGISFFDSSGAFQRMVRLQPFPSSARDFLVFENGDILISGAIPSSDHALHRYSPDGQYREGLGSLRTDLEEPVLRMRYGDGYVADAGAERIAYARRVPFEFMLYHQSERSVSVTHADIVHDYVHEVATPLEEGGWKFGWRHPSLGSFVRLPDGCYLAAVGRLPETVEGRLPEATDFHTELVFLSDQGRVLQRETLSFYFRPKEAWRDPNGGIHLLGIRRDQITGLNYPIQYLAASTTPNAESKET